MIKFKNHSFEAALVHDARCYAFAPAGLINNCGKLNSKTIDNRKIKYFDFNIELSN